MPVLAIDVSHYQQPDEMRWAEWLRARNVRLAIVRTGIGYKQDNAYPAHRLKVEEDTRWHVPVALYHALLHSTPEITYEPERQAREFWGRRFAGDELPLVVANRLIPRFWVDVEAQGVTDEWLRRFVAEWKRIASPVKLGIYTSAYYWGKLGISNAPAWAEHPLWVAHYGRYRPGYVGPPDRPTLPPPWKSYLLHQFSDRADWNGCQAMPGYPWPLDQNYLNEDTMPISDEQAARLRGHIADARAGAERVLAATGAMIHELEGEAAPPPPPAKHDMRHLNGQQIINLFARAFPPPADYFGIVTKAGLADLIHKRNVGYVGAAVEDLPLSQEEKNALIAALDG